MIILIDYYGQHQHAEESFASGAEDNGKPRKPEMLDFFNKGSAMEEGMSEIIFYRSDHY